MGNILEVHNLCKKYRGFELSNVSFTLERGYIMGFIGPNGAGKTTTIKAIMNLIKKDAGEITIFGKDHIKAESEIKQKIGFVYDVNHYYEDLSVRDMKRLTARFYTRWDEHEFDRYARKFELPQQKKIKELSRGMQMKFSLAVALSHQAELLIMDEPTSGLDPIFRRELLDILSDLMQDENKGIIFSTHITSDLDKIADYITFINKGKIVFSANKDFIMGSHAVVKGSTDLLNTDTRKLFTDIREYKFGFEGLTNQPDTVRKMFRDTAVIEHATLEDIMLYSAREES